MHKKPQRIIVYAELDNRACYEFGTINDLLIGLRAMKDAKTRKTKAKRSNLVLYRDKSGKWNITGHSTLDLAIVHSTRVVTNGKATSALVCHILYEERIRSGNNE